jgi:uncharacterized protein YaaW (UPF0174 family)
MQKSKGWHMPTKFVSNSILLDLLESSTPHERMALTQVVDPIATRPLEVIPLKEAVCEAGGHGVINWIRGQGTGYIDILDDVAQALEVKGIPSYRSTPVLNGLTIDRLEEMVLVKSAVKEKKVTIDQCIEYSRRYALDTENKVLIKLLEKAYEGFNPQQRREFDAKVAEVARKFGSSSGSGLAGTAGLMVIGNLGGFATYTLMSTVLSTVTFGALGFGAYTAASSLLSVVLGPVGWIAMGGAAIHALGKPELKKTIPIVANVAMIRQRVANYNRS